MYTVKKKLTDVYEVTNFGDRKEPDAVYTIRKTKCTCPAAWGKKTCKHVGLVNRFKTLKEGAWWFEIVGTEIISHRIQAFE
jgi:hypothetical protein